MATKQELYVAVIATDGFEYAELQQSMEALRKCGARVEVLSLHEGEIQGFDHFHKIGRIQVDRVLGDPLVTASQYGALVLPGGAISADRLRGDAATLRFVKDMNTLDRPIAAVSHGLWILMSAGLVAGRRITGARTIREDIRGLEGEWSDEEVVVDRNWITGRSAEELPLFLERMLPVFYRKEPLISEETRNMVWRARMV